MESGSASEEQGPAREILTVSALNRAVAGFLSRSFQLVRVRGEIANFTRAASGHWYFTLKDASAQVRCVMFRGRNVLAGFAPREGDDVEVLAQVGLYEPRGEFQLTVEALQRAGLGQLYERFLQLKQRLEAEGLFDARRKRALPGFPRVVGVVTSLQAAALRDVLTTLARRSPHVKVIVYPVPVQGEGAGLRIAAMLQAVSARAEVDVVLLVRGGGSIEDLWAFNEEPVARAIRACALPVVVGVGHESDFTIADFAADLRAPTPTAAAELAAPDRTALLRSIGEGTSALRRALASGLQRAQQRLDYSQRALATPRASLQAWRARLQQLSIHARHAMLARFSQALRGGDGLRARLQLRQPRTGVLAQALQRRGAVLSSAARHVLQERSSRLRTLSARLEALDPHAVLARGYALAADARGRLVRDAATLAAGDRLQLRFARGGASAQVLGVEPRRVENPPSGSEG